MSNMKAELLYARDDARQIFNESSQVRSRAY